MRGAAPTAGNQEIDRLAPRCGEKRESNMMKQMIRTAFAVVAGVAVVAGAAQAQQPKDIVQTAVAAGSFKTLAAALTAAGLVDTLKGSGPFTVFAPTDEAFDALPEGVLDALLLPENEAVLTSILTYHVVPGEVTSDQITDGDVATVEGQSVTVSTENGVMVNEATVTTTDVDASNGVIHVIDAVLIPPDVDPASLVS
jgi:uncharacterized surface protein with fasciclin (FAS1) repeats